MQNPRIGLVIRLLTQIRSEFDRLRWQSKPIGAFLIHRATNAEADGVLGLPEPIGQMIAMHGAGHRDFQQKMESNGQPRLRDDPILDVKGVPIVNVVGESLDVVMPAFRSVIFTGDNQNFALLAAIAIRAGKAISAIHLPSCERLAAWQFSTSSDLWWAYVFELAWSKDYLLLCADKRLWLPAEKPNGYIPYNLKALNALVASGFGNQLKVPENWLKRLPDAWASEIDDIVVASIDALDYLLGELSPNNVSAMPSFPINNAAAPVEQPSAKMEESGNEEEIQLQRRFKVALSFPGEHREMISKVAESLKNVLREERVFYDKFHEVELAAPNLDLKLHRFYRDESDLIVVFICGKYDEKEWCGIEWRAVRELIKTKKRLDEDVMFLRLDDAAIEGMLTIDGYIDVAGKDAQGIANLILQRWSADR